MITDANIREYLLGRLDSDVDLVESIDEETLTDPEFSMKVDVIEDEIIEDYLEGLLNSEDKRAVERHFLRPPERQRKLRTARLVSHYFETASRNAKAEQPTTARGIFKGFRIGQVLLSFRTCAEIAAAVVFAASTLIFLNQRHKLEIAGNQMAQQLSEARQRLAASDQQLQTALQSLQPAIATLNLVRPGVQRGTLVLPQVKINSGTRTLHIEVALASSAPGGYRVQLQHSGKSVWSQDKVVATAVSGGAILKLDIPADALPQGVSELALTPSEGAPLSYWFSVSRLQ